MFPICIKCHTSLLTVDVNYCCNSATELRVGDVVVAVDGTVVKTPKDAIRLISSGFGKVTISVLREEGNDENAQDAGSDGDSESPGWGSKCVVFVVLCTCVVVV